MIKQSVFVVKIFGGLGNQMFQYAFARALSLEKSVPFAMDVSWFKTQIDTSTLDGPDKREYLLDRFNIVEKYSGDGGSTLAHWVSKTPSVGLMLKNLGPVLNRVIPLEITESDFETKIRKISGNGTVLLQGYWQDYNYFWAHNDVIAKDFTLRRGVTDENRQYLEQIRSSNSVSVHVRRGDALKPFARKFYAMASMDYFVNAASLVHGKIHQPTFFVFSNDIKWVKANFEIDFPVIFIESDGPDYEHLYLMSRCKNNIIDISTFSWWAAWLNDNPSKIVIAPEQWVANPDDYHVTIPESWLRLKN